MKRKYSLTLFIALTLFGMSGAMYAQELSLEEGYGKVRWGVSMEEVRKTYKIDNRWKNEHRDWGYDHAELWSVTDGAIENRKFVSRSGFSLLPVEVEEEFVEIYIIRKRSLRRIFDRSRSPTGTGSSSM
jgi:hypothetical protein